MENRTTKTAKELIEDYEMGFITTLELISAAFDASVLPFSTELANKIVAMTNVRERAIAKVELELDEKFRAKFDSEIAEIINQSAK